MSKDKNEKNWFARHKVLTVVGIIIILGVIIGAASSGGNDDTGSNSSSNGSTNSQSEPKAEYAVGETVDIDKRQITVTDVERNFQTGNEFSQPESGKEFVVVTVTIKNNGDDALDYNTFDFKMQDSNGVQQDEDFTALTEGKLNSGSLAPGGQVTGKLAYQVPAGDEGLKLLFTNPSLFNNQTITIKL